MKTFLSKIAVSFCVLFYSEISLSQWIVTGKLNNLVYPSISAADSNTVWAAGGESSPVIYRTVNGGVNWSSILSTDCHSDF